MSDALRTVVLPLLDGVKPAAGGYVARCPAHEDNLPSLSVGPGKDHPVVFHCHAGCTPEMIINALGLTWKDLSTPRSEPIGASEWTPAGPAIAVYDYRDEAGGLLFQVLRTATKEFRQRVPDATTGSGWRWSLGDVRRVPYRLPELIEGVKSGRAIYVVEGEKDVATLVRAGQVATCNPGGAGKWRAEYAAHFRDAEVMIIADLDDTGQAHARKVRDALVEVAASVTIAEAASGKDVTEHLSAGFSLAELVVTWVGDEAPKPDLAPDLYEFLSTEDEPFDWIVPDLLERGDRLILTGFEGLGKSMLIRQLCVTIAAGIHPFRMIHTKPCKVLLIDCENSQRLSRRKFRPMPAALRNLGVEMPDGGLRLIHRPEGLDLTRADDEEWLLERVKAHAPDVLCIGPFYRLHAKDMNEELPARHVAQVLDRARVAANCAVITEAHAGHGVGGRDRSVRPAGSSLLMRWPEFGYGLTPVAGQEPVPGQRTQLVNVQGWRGPRDDREWPAMLRYGRPGELPWQEVGAEEARRLRGE